MLTINNCANNNDKAGVSDSAFTETGKCQIYFLESMNGNSFICIENSEVLDEPKFVYVADFHCSTFFH